MRLIGQQLLEHLGANLEGALWVLRGNSAHHCTVTPTPPPHTPTCCLYKAVLYRQHLTPPHALLPHIRIYSILLEINATIPCGRCSHLLVLHKKSCPLFQESYQGIPFQEGRRRRWSVFVCTYRRGEWRMGVAGDGAGAGGGKEGRRRVA